MIIISDSGEVQILSIFIVSNMLEIPFISFKFTYETGTSSLHKVFPSFFS